MNARDGAVAVSAVAAVPGANAFVPDVHAIACLDVGVARRERVVPLELVPAKGDGGRPCLVLASAGEADLPRRDRVRRALPASIDVVWRDGSPGDVARALDRCYGVDLALDDVVAACDAGAVRGGAPGASSVSDSGGPHPAPDPDGFGRPPPSGSAGGPAVPSPIVRLVDALLADAVARDASDIHLSPEEGFVRVRYRIDGVLRDVRRLERRHVDALTVRIKVLAGADIAETRRPQDGRFSRRVGDRRVDFRFSSFPLVTGENLVLRVLERGASPSGLDGLVPPPDTREVLRRLVHRPDGLVVVSGPTGAGKTTTLYALLGERDVSGLNVMTLEDPIEHPVAGIAQASIDAARGLDYSAGVRALLRQDPDVLLIGEVRDADSCAIALRAALTGHLVLTTVHATDALGVVGRLRELGAEPGVLADVLVGVVAQRLVRTRCAACGGRGTLATARPGDGDGTDGPCRRCDGRALAGRRAVLETLVPDVRFADLLRAGGDRATLAAHVADSGHRTLLERARELVATGITVPSELGRVFGTAAHEPMPPG